MNNPDTPQLTGSAPVLLVKDLPASIAHYRDTMGFVIDLLNGEPPTFAILQRDGLRVMLQQAEKPEDVVPNWKLSKSLWDIYFWVSNVDALYEEFQQRGAIIDYTLSDKPYGCREFGTRDLDDHDLAFGQIMGNG